MLLFAAASVSAQAPDSAVVAAAGTDGARAAPELFAPTLRPETVWALTRPPSIRERIEPLQVALNAQRVVGPWIATTLGSLLVVGGLLPLSSYVGTADAAAGVPTLLAVVALGTTLAILGIARLVRRGRAKRRLRARIAALERRLR